MPYSSEVAKAVDGYTARTIPVHAALEARQVVLSAPEMRALLGEAQLIAVGNCECRQKRLNCAAPLDVCLSLNEAAQEMLAHAGSRRVSLEEALDVLRRSHEAGLVHLAFRQGDRQVSVVCSCCSCCCWFLDALKRFSYHDAIAESGFVAAFDAELCNDCGRCVERCQFAAWSTAPIAYDAGRCFGCGVCVSTCPTGAITFVAR
jgi:hypothetical protein